MENFQRWVMIQSIDINNFGFRNCYGTRNLNPNCGCFLSPDPIGFEGGDTNFYRYVLNNPVKYNDPSGLLFANVVGGVLSAGEIAFSFALGFATSGYSLIPQLLIGYVSDTQTIAPSSSRPRDPQFNPNDPYQSLTPNLPNKSSQSNTCGLSKRYACQ